MDVANIIANAMIQRPKLTGVEANGIVRARPKLRVKIKEKNIFRLKF